MKLGKTPRQLLAQADSAEIGELIAYFALQGVSEEDPCDVEDKLRKAFGKRK